MSVHAPEVRLLFENARGELRPIGVEKFLPYAAAVDTVLTYDFRQSFGILVVEIDGDCGQGISIVVNGKDCGSRIIGGVRILRIPLDRDLFFTRLAFVAPPLYALTIDVVVEHHYQPKGYRDPDGIPKWTVSQLKGELSKYKIRFARSQQSGVLPDLQNNGIKSGADISAQLLLQIIGRLELAISTVSQADACVDFHEDALGEFDRATILAALKQNNKHLLPHPDGVIRFKGERYLTALSYRHLRPTTKVDFSEVAALLLACAAVIKGSAAPAVCSLLLSTLVEDIRARFPFKEVRNMVDAVLERNMHSPFGVLLQGHLRTLIAVVSEIAARDPIDHGLLWLKQSIQDRDVYQTSVFACCCKALGFTDDEVRTSDGLLKAIGVEIADTNTSKGMEFFNRKISSWRKKSIQPSEYRPDTFVFYQGQCVLVDAKFRMPPSTWLVAEADGLKDVQAYMNEFGLRTALVVVPRILNESSIGPEGFAVIEGGGNRILVVEMQDSDDLSTMNNLKLAVEHAAHTA